MATFAFLAALGAMCVACESNIAYNPWAYVLVGNGWCTNKAGNRIDFPGYQWTSRDDVRHDGGALSCELDCDGHGSECIGYMTEDGTKCDIILASDFNAAGGISGVDGETRNYCWKAEALPEVLAGEYGTPSGIFFRGITSTDLGEPGPFGVITFQIFCDLDGSFKLGAETHGPNGKSDSFRVQLDNGERRTWHTGNKNAFVSSYPSPSISATAGHHTLRLWAREDGISIRELGFYELAPTGACHFATEHYAQADWHSAPLVRDEGNDGKECGNVGDANRVFDLRDGHAREGSCRGKCDEIPECVAFSGKWGSWCVGCQVPLSAVHAGAIAYKKEWQASAPTEVLAGEYGTPSGIFYKMITSIDHSFGAITFQIFCDRPFSFKLCAETQSPDSESESFSVQLDNGVEHHWDTGPNRAFGSTCPDYSGPTGDQRISDAAGKHTLRLLAWKGGISIRKLSFYQLAPTGACRFAQDEPVEFADYYLQTSGARCGVPCSATENLGDPVPCAFESIHTLGECAKAAKALGYPFGDMRINRGDDTPAGCYLDSTFTNVAGDLPIGYVQNPISHGGDGEGAGFRPKGRMFFNTATESSSYCGADSNCVCKIQFGSDRGLVTSWWFSESAIFSKEDSDKRDVTTPYEMIRRSPLYDVRVGAVSKGGAYLSESFTHFSIPRDGAAATREGDGADFASENHLSMSWTHFTAGEDAYVYVETATAFDSDPDIYDLVTIRPKNLLEGPHGLKIEKLTTHQIRILVPYSKANPYKKFSVEFKDQEVTFADDHGRAWHTYPRNALMVFVSPYITKQTHAEFVPAFENDLENVLVLEADQALDHSKLCSENVWVLEADQALDHSKQCSEHGDPLFGEGYSTIYFKPGVHWMGSAHYAKIHSDVKWVYLAPGAFVKGAFEFDGSVEDGKKYKVTGYGVISGQQYAYEPDRREAGLASRNTSKHSDCHGDCLKLLQVYVQTLGESLEMSGITLADPPYHSFVVYFKKGYEKSLPMDVHNLNQVGGWYYQTDGIELYDNSKKNQVFYHVNDDALKLYQSNVEVTNIVVWNSGGNGPAIQFGWYQRDFHDVTVENVTMIHNVHRWYAHNGCFLNAANHYDATDPKKIANFTACEEDNTVRNLRFNNLKAEGLNWCAVRIHALNDLSDVVVHNLEVEAWSPSSIAANVARYSLKNVCHKKIGEMHVDSQDGFDGIATKWNMNIAALPSSPASQTVPSQGQSFLRSGSVIYLRVSRTSPDFKGERRFVSLNYEPNYFGTENEMKVLGEEWIHARFKAGKGGLMQRFVIEKKDADTSSTIHFGDTIYIKSAVTGKSWDAGPDKYGWINARYRHMGEWEAFEISSLDLEDNNQKNPIPAHDASKVIQLKSLFNGKYVTVKIKESLGLQADAIEPGRFEIEEVKDCAPLTSLTTSMGRQQQPLEFDNGFLRGHHLGYLDHGDLLGHTITPGEEACPSLV